MKSSSADVIFAKETPAMSSQKAKYVLQALAYLAQQNKAELPVLIGTIVRERNISM